MKILHRYVLKEHAGPLAFALGALTSLLLLNQVAKRFGDLAGKGLPWSVIGEFFALAVPFIVAMTLPMAVLVATLYAFSRLAAENEITALKASGVGMRRVIGPVMAAAVVVTLGMILFNDQLLPRSNHRLAVLQRDIAQKKPTFALREQVINEVSQGQLYLRAGHLDENSNRMREITIYDFADPTRRRTIYADSGSLAMSADNRDLLMTLHDGMLQDVPTDTPEQLQRLFFRTDRIRVEGVGNQFRKSETGAYKGEREMTLCEMAENQMTAITEYARFAKEFRVKVAQAKRSGVELSEDILRARSGAPMERTLGSVYCAGMNSLIAGFGRVRSLLPIGSREASAQQPAERDMLRARAPRDAVTGERATATSDTAAGVPATATNDTATGPPALPMLTPDEALRSVPAIEGVRSRMVDHQRVMNLYAVEIHKKLALAVACFVFVLLGAPIAVRFPRGGVGLVIGVSIVVFGLYYVALIGGQSLGVRGAVQPAIAMWGANVLFGATGLVLLVRMGRQGATTRGGDAREMLEAVRTWLAQQLAQVGVRAERRQHT